jgi:hypothetical protein
MLHTVAGYLAGNLGTILGGGLVVGLLIAYWTGRPASLPPSEEVPAWLRRDPSLFPRSLASAGVPSPGAAPRSVAPSVALGRMFMGLAGFVFLLAGSFLPVSLGGGPLGYVACAILGAFLAVSRRFRALAVVALLSIVLLFFDVLKAFVGWSRFPPDQAWRVILGLAPSWGIHLLGSLLLLYVASMPGAMPRPSGYPLPPSP